VKIKFFYLVFFLFPHLFAFTASPLFHAIIAEKWLAAFEDYNEEDKQAFFLGTLFPDIRYSAGLPRTATHEPGFTLEEIRAIQDPFLKGMRVHVFVDEEREIFFSKQKALHFYDAIPGDRVLHLKFLEDEILYSMREEVAPLYISNYLQHIDKSELKFNIPLEILQNWHQLNKDYLSMRPSDALAKLIASHRGYANISVEITQVFYEVMCQFRENPQAVEYVSSAIAEFDKIFSYGH